MLTRGLVLALALAAVPALLGCRAALEPVPTPTAATVATATPAPGPAERLSVVYRALRQAGRLERCPPFRDGTCLHGRIDAAEAMRIALALGVIDATAPDPGVRIGLDQGAWLESGVHFEDKESLEVEDGAWYWEVGACATNRRVYVDAVTGRIGAVHTWVYCRRGGVRGRRACRSLGRL